MLQLQIWVQNLLKLLGIFFLQSLFGASIRVKHWGTQMQWSPRRADDSQVSQVGRSRQCVRMTNAMITRYGRLSTKLATSAQLVPVTSGFLLEIGVSLHTSCYSLLSTGTWFWFSARTEETLGLYTVCHSFTKVNLSRGRRRRSQNLLEHKYSDSGYRSREQSHRRKNFINWMKRKESSETLYNTQNAGDTQYCHLGVVAGDEKLTGSSSSESGSGSRSFLFLLDISWAVPYPSCFPVWLLHQHLDIVLTKQLPPKNSKMSSTPLLKKLLNSRTLAD